MYWPEDLRCIEWIEAQQRIGVPFCALVVSSLRLTSIGSGLGMRLPSPNQIRGIDDIDNPMTTTSLPFTAPNVQTINSISLPTTSPPQPTLDPTNYRQATSQLSLEPTLKNPPHGAHRPPPRRRPLRHGQGRHQHPQRCRQAKPHPLRPSSRSDHRRQRQRHRRWQPSRSGGQSYRYSTGTLVQSSYFPFAFHCHPARPSNRSVLRNPR